MHGAFVPSSRCLHILSSPSTTCHPLHPKCTPGEKFPFLRVPLPPMSPLPLLLLLRLLLLLPPPPPPPPLPKLWPQSPPSPPQGFLLKWNRRAETACLTLSPLTSAQALSSLGLPLVALRGLSKVHHRRRSRPLQERPIFLPRRPLPPQNPPLLPLPPPIPPLHSPRNHCLQPHSRRSILPPRRLTSRSPPLLASRGLRGSPQLTPRVQVWVWWAEARRRKGRRGPL
mmetsp:Transcript_25705/g.50315  ORF Transcript_25705/g.50315 Transcript_25705/m.50315 type:complete len:227 (-) Transcript_25705:1308-1988(-)